MNIQIINIIVLIMKNWALPRGCLLSLRIYIHLCLICSKSGRGNISVGPDNNFFVFYKVNLFTLSFKISYKILGPSTVLKCSPVE